MKCKLYHFIIIKETKHRISVPLIALVVRNFLWETYTGHLNEHVQFSVLQTPII